QCLVFVSDACVNKRDPVRWHILLSASRQELVEQLLRVSYSTGRGKCLRESGKRDGSLVRYFDCLFDLFDGFLEHAFLQLGFPEPEPCWDEGGVRLDNFSVLVYGQVVLSGEV